MDLAKSIKDNRPNISDNSVKTYCSLLNAFFYRHHDKTTAINSKWFEDQDLLLDLLKDRPVSTRKTLLAALVSITKDNEKYKKAMMTDGQIYKDFIDKQQKTKSQEENWKSFEEIQDIYNNMYNRVKPLLNGKIKLDTRDIKLLQDFIILSLTTGVWMPPRRSTDWIEMHTSPEGIDKNTSNYIDKGFFVFNKYKTAKFYNEQRVEIPKGLKAILNKWVKINPNKYLITGSNGEKITNVQLTQRLNQIFDGKISTSMLRHIFLSEKLKNVPALRELQDLAHDMGHSVSEAIEYVKH
jgi:hypothetical protein